jgi:hypothetical protein
MTTTDSIHQLHQARWIKGAVESRAARLGIPYDDERHIYQRARRLVKRGTSPAMAIAWAMRAIDDIANSGGMTA